MLTDPQKVGDRKVLEPQYSRLPRPSGNWADSQSQLSQLSSFLCSDISGVMSDIIKEG